MLGVKWNHVSTRGPKHIHKYRIMNGLAWTTMCLSWVKQFGNDFHDWRRHELKSLPNYYTSDKNLDIHVNSYIILFLIRHFMRWTYESAINNHRCSFRHCHQERPFLIYHCDVTTVDLWHLLNARYWYCDFIFIDCFCAHNLAQSWSSLVNDNREYRFPATRHSWFNV